MYMIMYKICTQKKCKVALFTHKRSHISYVSVRRVFSLCIFRSWTQPNRLKVIPNLILWHFVTDTKEKYIRKAKTHTVTSRIKSNIRLNCWLLNIKLFLILWVETASVLFSLTQDIQKEQTGQDVTTLDVLWKTEIAKVPEERYWWLKDWGFWERFLGAKLKLHLEKCSIIIKRNHLNCDKARDMEGIVVQV